MMNSGLCQNTGNYCLLNNPVRVQKLKYMRKDFLLLLMIIAISFAQQGYSQINVFHIDNNSTTSEKDGIFYALPRTVIKIDVTIDRIENYKGPYSEYALRYLGLKNVVESTSVEYKITDMRVTTSPQPDPDQYYFIELGEKMSKSEKSGLLAFSESGLLLGMIKEMPDSTVSDVVRKPGSSIIETEQDVFPEVFKYSADVSFFEKIDTIIRKVNIDTMTIERQVLKRTMVEKPLEQKAKEAADFISKIKDNRFNLISGYQEVNYNKETLEYMDEQLKMLQREYMKLFTGISLHKPLIYTYTFTPNSVQVNTEVPIFKFHRGKGLLALDEPGGKIVTIKVQRSGTTGVVSGFLKRNEDTKKLHGFFYRIPELAKVTVKVDENLQEETQCLVNQLGIISFLPVNKWKVNFYPETGGIKSLNLE